MSLPIPGNDVLIVEAPRRTVAPTDTGVGFMVGELERGPAFPFECNSFADFQQQGGARESYSYVSDAAETFFQEGGGTLWIQRVQSASAVAASCNLQDATTSNTMKVTAGGVGAYANAQKAIVQVNSDDASIPVGSFRIVVTENGVTILTTPIFATKQQAYDWSASQVVPVVVLSDLGGTGVPAHVASPGTALTGGNDDRGNVNDAAYQAALDKIVSDYGPGQIAAPGRTTQTGHVQLTNHGLANKRSAVLDSPNTASISTLAAGALADDANAAALAGRWGSPFWPWAVIPGLTPTSTRLVPWSAVQMALDARTDALGNPNQIAAGEQFGQTRWVIGLSQDTSSLDDSDLQTLQDAGVNVARQFRGGGRPVSYGNRTLRSEVEDPYWLQRSGTRCIMAIAARGNAILRRYTHIQVDGKKRQQSAAGGEISAMLGQLFDLGAIFGDSPEEAFSVDTGDAVNPLAQLQAGLMKAQVRVRVSPGADHVTLELVRAPITEVLS